MSENAHVARLLDNIYDARTSNHDRKAATLELDMIKDQPGSLSLGLALAQDRHRTPTARYYGLCVLEHGIRYRWDTYTDDESRQFRGWLLGLAHDVNGQEPLFVRNKIAQLVEEVAERSWGLGWHDFDEQLCLLWDRDLPHKQIVLSILETLSDKIFGKDDIAAGLRGAELGKLCVDLFTPPQALANGNGIHHGSHGDAEGWLSRLVRFLMQSLESGDQSANLRECFMMTMSLLRSSMSWVLLKAVSNTECVAVLRHCVSLPDPQLNMTALEVLHALYHRANYSRHQIETLVGPFLGQEGLSLLQNAYERLCTNVDDLDEAKYGALKRLTEVICSLAMFFERNTWLVDTPTVCDLGLCIRLLVNTLSNPSLTVSIPIVYLWTKLLNIRQVRYSAEFQQVMGEMLEICRSRLIRYEMFPSDSDDSVFRFLNEDFDTVPEKHAFIGNYRRFCVSIIERVVRRSPFDALSYILTQSSELLQRLTEEGKQQGADHVFVTDSPEHLLVEAQCTVAHTAVRSYLHWSTSKTSEGESLESEKEKLNHNLEAWCISALESSMDDPIVQKRVLLLVVDVAVLALPSSSRVGLELCERILSMPLVARPGSTPHDEAVKDLQSTQPRELQKLAGHYADQYFMVYDKIQALVQKRLNGVDVEQRIQLDHQAFLLVVSQRSSIPANAERQARLDDMVSPAAQRWQEPRLQDALTGMERFLQMLGLQDFSSYFIERNAQSIEDWSSVPLDAHGVRMRDSIHRQLEELPLQPTRILLSICTSGSSKGDSVSEQHLEHLRPLLPIVLPRLLQMLGYAHSFSNPEKWESYRPGMRDIVTRIVRDRVWQNGISTETRDSFFQRIKESRESLEGLASTVRGSIRGVREFSMWILHSFTNFGDAFYGLAELSGPLARALYEDAYWLSPHQLSALLNLSITIIEKCPPKYRKDFLPPILLPLFKSLDAKVTSEWDAITERTESGAASDNLEAEMKNEAVIRNLTHSAVLFTSSMLSFPARGSQQDDDEPTIRSVILTSPEILEALIVLATHTIRMHDSRSCAVITRVLRTLIPEFQHHDSVQSVTTNVIIDGNVAATVREYVCTEILKACITSINEPYFAELQKDLAALVAAIINFYSPRTDTPRQILQSLPGMSAVKVNTHFEQIIRASSERQQRGSVLNLLENVRGTSIYEQGKIQVNAPRRSALEERFMNQMAVDDDDNVTCNGRKKDRHSPDLGGVADLLG